MKKWKWGILIVIVMVAVLIKESCSPVNWEKKARELVLENEEELEKIAQQCIAGEEELNFEGIKKIQYWSDYPLVEFFMGGMGIVPASTYYGFYYSPDDKPMAFMDNGELVTEEKDSWKWTSVGDNHGHVRKIKDKWYYYDASF